MEYKILLAQKSDCELLSKIKREVWETTYRGIYPDKKIDNYDFNENKKYFEQIVENKEIELFIVKKDERIIGYMSVGKPIIEYANYEQTIGLLYILKEFQRQGIGEKLFNIAYKLIKGKGYKEFFISCDKYNFSAQKFYKKMGGKIVHIEDDFEDEQFRPQIKFHYDVV